jgi:hypothetical protein
MAATLFRQGDENMCRIESEKRSPSVPMNRSNLSTELVEQTEFEPENFVGLLCQIRFEEILSRSSKLLPEKTYIAARLTGLSDERKPRFNGVPWNAIKEVAECIP